MEPEIKQEPEQPNETVVMQIILTKDGGMRVAGLIHDKIIAYGILEAAKEQIKDFHERNSVKLHKPEHRIMDFLRNGKK